MTQRCNLLIGCDQVYYEQWGVNLLKSIHFFNPWITLHAHIVNPKKFTRLEYVNYTFVEKNFNSDKQKIGYLQSCRFIAVAEKFSNKDLVMTIDTDSICTREVEQEYFIQTAKNTTVLRHHKDKRWLAGMITFGQNNFKQDYLLELNKVNQENWAPFHDQNCLRRLSNYYDFNEQDKSRPWMKYGKNAEKGIFMTLKGDQKIANKYLEVYNSILQGVN